MSYSQEAEDAITRNTPPIAGEVFAGIVSVTLPLAAAKYLRDVLAVTLASERPLDCKLLTVTYRDRTIELWQDADSPTYFAVVGVVGSDSGSVHIDDHIDVTSMQAVYDSVCARIDRRIANAEARKAKAKKA